MRLIGTAALLVLLAPPPSHAGHYSCATVRAFVAQYGRTQALMLARAYGITAVQLRQARACL